MVGGVGGDIIGGVGAYEAGKYNRKSDYAAATAEEQDGADQEDRIRQNARAAIGEQIAAQGQSGFQQGTGTALEALQQSQVNATLDALTARRKAATAAASRRQQGDIAYATGKNGLVAGLIKAGNDAAAIAGGAPSGGGGAPAVPSYQGVDWASPKSYQSDGYTISTTSGYNGGI